jgi:hypothetical protein
MTMMRESASVIVARNETWSGHGASEPYEAGWAQEAIVFVRALKPPTLKGPAEARVEISPDGMRWVAEGTRFQLPSNADETTYARVRHFGNWLRVAADLEPGTEITVLVTLQLKA